MHQSIKNEATKNEGSRSVIVILEIVILAMVAAFLGLRLYSVLGRRAEHEEHSIPSRFDPTAAPAAPAPIQGQADAPAQIAAANSLPSNVQTGLKAIASADHRFDLFAFVEGAKGAYGMILGAFWSGDRETLRELCDDDVYEGFDAAITAREQAGETLDNRLVRIEEVSVEAASLVGHTARIALRFSADIAAVTRDKDGTVVAGSLNDAIASNDLWTFSRNITSQGPDWVLDETDEG